ncbi:MAG: phosphoglycerate kinase [Planctomycetaceae bacterium]|nr:phosphoglycerate kinase [Planctomycetales bacterium]MCB9924232.1 phosphoglycerate kinase [Planctomycetaceae bacterium]
MNSFDILPQLLVDAALPNDARVFLRADLNVPLDQERIVDDLRIERSLPSIQFALERGAKLIMASHLGRPEPGWSAELSMKPVAEHLSRLLGKSVRLVPENGSQLPGNPDDWSQAAVGALRDVVAQMRPGEVVLWENLRFHPGEKQNSTAFAESFADVIDAYCHDAFGAAQNNDASLVALQQVLARQDKPRVAGMLLVDELRELGRLLESPPRPFVVVMGGAKVGDKSKTIRRLLDKCDDLLIGGALAYPFLKERESSIGASKLDADDVPLAKQILDHVDATGKRLHLPVDHWAVTDLQQDQRRVLQVGSIRDGLCGIDIGPETARKYAAIIRQAGTVFWNGPMGLFDLRRQLEYGTRSIAESIAEVGAIARNAETEALTIVGGGESATAVRQFGLDSEFSFVSTGGGASLRLLAGDEFESVALLGS